MGRRFPDVARGAQGEGPALRVARNLASGNAQRSAQPGHGSARLVELAEAKLRGTTAPASEFATELEGLLGQRGGDRIDTVVLACTHFPLVVDELQAAAPRPIRFIDGAEGIARRVAVLTEGQVWPEHKPRGIAVFTAALPPSPPLERALAAYGLDQIETL